MNRQGNRKWKDELGMPHVGGDEPQFDKDTDYTALYAPRRWG